MVVSDGIDSRCFCWIATVQACAIEEELLHISAPSRLDYFKSGFEFENRVKLKKDQLQGQLAALDAKRRASGGGGNQHQQQQAQQQQQHPQQQQQQKQHGGSGQGREGDYKKQRI